MDHMKKNYLLPDVAYDALKWVGLIALPGAAWFVSVVGPAWGWPAVDAVVTTLNAAGTLVGLLIGVSQLSGGDAA